MNKRTSDPVLRLTVLILSLVLLMGTLGGCSRTVVENTPQEEDKIQIGFTFDSFVIERWHRERDIFVSAASELGAEVNVQTANGDIDEQIRQINYFIDKGVDVIVIVHVADENKTVNDALARAKTQGIKVIAYDRLVLNSDVDLYISFDNEKVGQLMAEHMTEHIGDSGDILAVTGPRADYNVTQLEKGFTEVMEASGTELRVTETHYAPNWLAETAFYVTGDYLKRSAIPAGVMAGNDSLAGQAVKALAEKRLAGKVCVVGQDADLDACQRIVEGTQCMTVYKPVEKMARRAAELAVRLAEGEALDVTETIDAGTGPVLYCKMDPVAVTKENMDEEITGKYHEASDIYLNVEPSAGE